MDTSLDSHFKVIFSEYIHKKAKVAIVDIYRVER